ncbi:Uncharacterised protein [Streptococcus constellatus]|uniref:DUF3169 family protein n=1 Tax=Streptococcus constellatus TaxID=76860 RepID=A0A564SVU2_STRCV|nr:DUF3169 family protein [Streptococcus constellatus]VUW98913.1 Uncharacterised protein [Streptococcus constellatus]VUX07117.1 Uncharacterised protein [Streptococcus gordonii]
MKKWMKISGLIVVSILLGIFVASSWLGNFHFPTFLNSTLFGWMIRVFNLILFCMTIYLLSSSRKIQKQSESRKENELNEQLYQKMFKTLEYGTISLDVMTILVIFDILTSLSVAITRNSLLLTMSLFPYLTLLFVIYGQYYLQKTIEQVRHFKLPVFAFPEDILAFMKTYDEAEREAHYEQSFKILFQLNQFILPALYIFIFVISLSLREIQYLPIAIVVFIHLYINVMNISMVKNYFK